MTTLTNRDHEIIRALAHHVSALSEEQILWKWFPRTAAGRKNGQRRLRALTKGQILVRQVVHAKTIRQARLICDCPMHLPPPDFNALARESRGAWSLPVRPAVIYSATTRIRRLVGGAPAMKVTLPSLSHTLGVSAVYIAILAQSPDLIDLWHGEHECISTGFREAQPDAFLKNKSGQTILAFEFAADYPPDRFRRLDTTLRSKQIPYLVYGAAQ